MTDLSKLTDHQRERASSHTWLASYLLEFARRLNNGETPAQAARKIRDAVRLLNGEFEMRHDDLWLFSELAKIPPTPVAVSQAIAWCEKRAAKEATALAGIVGW